MLVANTDVGGGTGADPHKTYPTVKTLSNNKQLEENVTNITEDLLQNHNIVNRYNAGFYNKFARYPFIDPYTTARKTKEYLFFTKPDLNLFDKQSGSDFTSQLKENSTFFRDTFERYKDLAYMLQYSHSYSTFNPFIPMLTNAVASSMDMPGISADYIETGRNVYGSSIRYRGSSFKSDLDYDFSLDFKDNKYLDVYMFFKMYDEYERLKWLGLVSPRSDDYIKNKILHDQISIYKIVVGEDGMSILYYARAVGVFPTSVPRDSLGDLSGDITFPVSFYAKFIYDMDPRILNDFNIITEQWRGTNPKYLPLFNTDKKEYEGQWARCPVIFTNPDYNPDDYRSRQKFYLRWLA